MIRGIQAKSILIRRPKIDSWFLTHYGMNLYRGCAHNCAYCDGRSESYYVDGEFGRDVIVKVNAVDVVSRELDPVRKRKPLPKSFMMLGGGVCDAYQPAEERYTLTRRILELCAGYDFPVHILTKSTLVERDVDLLLRIRERRRVVVSFSFSSADDRTGRIFEPGVPVPSERLNTMQRLKRHGFFCGMFLMPVLPFITDTPDMLENTIRQAKEAGADFIIFGGMTLKEGRQKAYFMKVLNERYPHLVSRYGAIYRGDDRWGAVNSGYDRSVTGLFNQLARKYKIPKRIPPAIYHGVLSKSDETIVVLEHLDYLLHLDGRKSAYGYAAFQLSRNKEALERLSDAHFPSIQGIGPDAVAVIKEIAETGRCALYETLLYD